jgi:hypothetical protein
LTCTNNRAKYRGGCFDVYAGAVGVSHSEFQSNRAGKLGGAIDIRTINAKSRTKLTVVSTRFIKNRAAVGGAISVGPDSLAAVKRCHFERNVAVRQGGAIAVQMGTIAIMLSRFVANQARSLGAAVHVDQPISVKILDAVFDPFVGGALVVFIGGRLAGCDQHPCGAGHSCSYAKYSLHCTPCPRQQFSAKGLTCASCPAGQGPMLNQSGCVQCGGNAFSAFGVCTKCPLGMVSTADGVGCTPRTTVFGKDVDCAPAFGFTRTSKWAQKPRKDTLCDSLNCVSCGSNGTNIEVKQGWRLHMAGNIAAVLRCPNRDACEQRCHPGCRTWVSKTHTRLMTMHSTLLLLTATHAVRIPRFSANSASGVDSSDPATAQKCFLKSIINRTGQIFQGKPDSRGWN